MRSFDPIERGGWDLDMTHIAVLQSRIHENNLILNSEDLELQTTRATFLAAEHLMSLYQRWEARKKGFDSEIKLKAEITLYKTFLTLLTQKQP
jgi:hypothetical protein